MRKRLTRRWRLDEHKRVLFGLDGGGEFDRGLWRFTDHNGVKHKTRVWDRGAPDWMERDVHRAEWPTDTERARETDTGQSADIDVRTAVIRHGHGDPPVPKGWTLVTSVCQSYGAEVGCPRCNCDGEANVSDSTCKLCEGNGWITSDGYDTLCVYRRVRWTS